MSNNDIEKVVLAYSGGLDTSVIVPWLRENYECQVICMAADIGQGEELDGLQEKALASGASKLVVKDLKEEFASDYLFPLLRTGAIYERQYLLGTAIARPLIAKWQVTVARGEGADAVAHGCTGKGNDQVRFELTYKALAPELQVIAPWREWEIRSREDALAYAQAHEVPVAASAGSIYSRDRNLWHISHEGGDLEDPAKAPDESLYQWTASPEAAPDKPEVVRIDFESGVPAAVNGRRLTPAALVQQLNEVGARHAVGRVDMVENRLVGVKSRGVYETPGGTLLVGALRELESICLDRDTAHFKEALALRYAELVYDGKWFTPLRKGIQAFIERIHAPVTGWVQLKLYKGNVVVMGRGSEYSLYREDLATFGQDDVYDQSEAAGFINLFGLQMKVGAMLELRRKGAGDLSQPDYSAFKRD